MDSRKKELFYSAEQRCSRLLEIPPFQSKTKVEKLLLLIIVDVYIVTR